MTEREAIELFKCLSDKSRILILKSLVKEAMYVELLAQRLNLTPSTISFHLKKLEAAGIVTSKKDQYYMIYQIREELLNTTILDILRAESSEEEIQKEREESYRKKVLNSFFQHGKLKSIPVQRKKEKIILEVIVESFEQNRDYTEKEVNLLISDYYDDFCTIRRDMISDGLLTRTGSIYRKC